MRDHVPAVIERQRVRLIDPGLPTQPYEHDSRAMREDDANALIGRVRHSSSVRALEALQRIATDLVPAYALVGLAIRKPPFPELPRTVATVWASHPLLCSADGMLYHFAICNAARQLGLEVHLCRRGEETSRAAERLGVTPDEIEEFVSRTGRPPGPPWTQEHRRAYAAGIAMLAAHARGRVRLPTSESTSA